MLEASTELRDALHDNTQYFRSEMKIRGFSVPDGNHPIVPVMLGDALLTQKMSERLLEQGIYAVGFFYPVVPKDLARIRVQLSASHSIKDIDFALDCFKKVGSNLGVI